MSVMAGRLSVWPPESASAVTSWAIGMRRASSACSAVRCALADQLLQEALRRRREEPRRHLDARHLGDDAVGRDDAAVAVAMDAGGAIADHGQRQVEVRRRLDEADAAAQVQIDDGRFDARLVGRVDEVEAVRQVAEVCLEAVDGLLDAAERQARGAEEAEHAGPAIASTMSAEPMPLAIAPAA